MLILLGPRQPVPNHSSRKFWWLYLLVFIACIVGIAIARFPNIRILKKQASQITALENTVRDLTSRYESNVTRLQELGSYINDSITAYHLYQYTGKIDINLSTISCFDSLRYVFKTVELFLIPSGQLLAANVRVVFWPGASRDSITIWYRLKDYTRQDNNYIIHFTSENLQYSDRMPIANITIYNREAERIEFSWNNFPINNCSFKRVDTMTVVWPSIQH